MGKSNPPPKSRSYSMTSQGSGSSPMSMRRPSQNPSSSMFNWSQAKSSTLYSSKRSLLPDHLLDAREMMSQAHGQHRDLLEGIEGLPAAPGLSPLDQDLLMLKATSMATMTCLNDCLHILHLQQLARQRGALGGPTIEWLEPKLPDLLKNGSGFPSGEGALLEGDRLELSAPETTCFSPEQEEMDPEDEVEDTITDTEEDLGAVEEERSIILHLLSQLKLGMDLTRVVLPTFILEKRSLLEMYADFMSHPDLFASIADGNSPEDRMVRFVQYYLTSFHEGRKGPSRRSPTTPSSERPSTAPGESPVSPVPSPGPRGSTRCTSWPSRSLTILLCPGSTPSVPTRRCASTPTFGPRASSWACPSECCLHLLEHEEEYTFTLPCAYARSILTVPWVELGGKVNINCTKSGYSAVITFQTKPFYGGKLHKVTAEVKHNSTNAVVCRVQGEWNGSLEFSYPNGDTRVVDVTRLPVTKKLVRPHREAGSHRVQVTRDRSTETEGYRQSHRHKRILEERQRTEERLRAESQTPWRTRYFQKEGEGWVYHKPLWKKLLQILVCSSNLDVIWTRQTRMH
ncbi:hypothetical protein WMY93_022323 [Mugilogobius chulae]|uniref:Oxysterol binding protein like 10 n=1 Tax=Mugilogobius chulae TaxID=88201 RepID=A0AAW0NJ25_9GOBI